MTAPAASGLAPALDRLTARTAAAVVSRARLSSPALTRVLLRRLGAAPGAADAMVADPVLEAARRWKAAPELLAALGGDLLSEDLVAALASAPDYAWPRDRHPHLHQLIAWRESLANRRSVLVSAGTGSGKTECFLIPILQDILSGPRRPGVRAILLYPLNALIESQRERLAAWAAGLGGRVRFALLNGDTPETDRKAGQRSGNVELVSRKAIRERPPEILVTNITMLEYLLLRQQDRSILEASAGALRWIVLDEAHGYVGSQAAEMALLLRRVRAAFGVEPGDVRLMATSATIGGEADALARLRRFLADLAGRPEEDCAVVEGEEDAPLLPAPGADAPLDPAALSSLAPEAAGEALAPHPRVQRLRAELGKGAVRLSDVGRILFDDGTRRADTLAMMDACGRALRQGEPLMPWRSHLFVRAQGGLFACLDPACPRRDPELCEPDAAWPFGALHLAPQHQCGCGAPVFELKACGECGDVFLEAREAGGAEPRLSPTEATTGDDYALDVEPEEDGASAGEGGATVLIGRCGAGRVHVTPADGRVFDNAPPKGTRAVTFGLTRAGEGRSCCAAADAGRMQLLHFGPPFLMGAALPQLMEDLAPRREEPGLPAGGRRAITFSDSRQGVARLAAKLQQEAERALTRAFLWHVVQEGQPVADPKEIERLDRSLAKFRRDPEQWADEIADTEKALAALTGVAARRVPWRELVGRLAQHEDLQGFAGAVWKDRPFAGELAQDPEKLAEMFLYRELFRRPRVQNNPETLGLLRLSFPELEARAAAMTIPRPLADAGVDHAGWTGLALAAVDFVFRNTLAVDLPSASLVRLISPRFGTQRGVVPVGSSFGGSPDDSRIRRFPGPIPGARPGPLHRMVYALTGGHWSDPIEQDRAGTVLDSLWSLISSTACVDRGLSGWRIDMTRAAVVRMDEAFLCPVTRRPFGSAVAGRSPYSLATDTPLAATPPMDRVPMPRLPRANAGGLDEAAAAEVTRWVATDPAVAALRERGLWTNIHDRLAAFPRFLRAQEHSAQLPRQTLKLYEDEFRAGRINLLNCSTTMEMGVDIPQVSLVVNANVPPALANYRQRSGRAGRRDEPWAFTVTYCRDLPLDRRTFRDPSTFLGRGIAAPRVLLESVPLVRRHVNAALLSAWLAEQGGINVRTTIGWFLGAGGEDEAPLADACPAEDFRTALIGDWGADPDRARLLGPLVAGTVLADRPVAQVVADCAALLEHLATRWRAEYRELRNRAAALPDKEARDALELRARRLAGEFLLGELGRRDFTPAYGFPTDVVSFEQLRGRNRGDPGGGESHLVRGGATRELHIALREYAPGAELVVDGLVHRSEGVRPAWSADTDASRLEDLRYAWTCATCDAVGLDQLVPECCPNCGTLGLSFRRMLRPAGFIGAEPPHTGYEALAYVPLDPPRLWAGGGDWVALPDPAAGRTRADPAGLVVTRAGGEYGGGYAVCLDCGRAQSMEPPRDGLEPPLPEAMRGHRPLLPARRLDLKATGGRCPGGLTAAHRVLRNIWLGQEKRTDIAELQLPEGAREPSALALAAGLRLALARRLGVEPREIGPAAGPSHGPADEPRVSAFLHDRAAGGAGLSSRLVEDGQLDVLVEIAGELLDCPEGCLSGCPTCVLEPDLNQRDLRLDRRGGLALAREILPRLALPEPLKVLGPLTRALGRPATATIEQAARDRVLAGLELWLHGDPADWDLPGWPIAAALPRLGLPSDAIRLHVSRAALTHAGFDLAVRLSLYRLAAFCRLSLVEALPEAQGRPVLARVERAGQAAEAMAADPDESLPNASWGAGASAPVVRGPAPDGTEGVPLSADRLMELSAGKAHLLLPGSELDGPAADFGMRFWSWLGQHAALEIAAISAGDATRVSYTDRYLLTPLSVLLLESVIRAAPVGSTPAVTVDIAPADRLVPVGRWLHDGFRSDAERVELLRALIPKADVRLAARKGVLPHHRMLAVELADGRCLKVYFDQGFGAWRSAGAVPHPFADPPKTQARALARQIIMVTGPPAANAPLTVTLDEAAEL